MLQSWIQEGAKSVGCFIFKESESPEIKLPLKFDSPPKISFQAPNLLQTEMDADNIKTWELSHASHENTQVFCRVTCQSGAPEISRKIV